MPGEKERFAIRERRGWLVASEDKCSLARASARACKEEIYDIAQFVDLQRIARARRSSPRIVEAPLRGSSVEVYFNAGIEIEKEASLERERKASE